MGSYLAVLLYRCAVKSKSHHSNIKIDYLNHYVIPINTTFGAAKQAVNTVDYFFKLIAIILGVTKMVNKLI